MVSAFKNTYGCSSHHSHLLSLAAALVSKERPLSDPDLRAVFRGCYGSSCIHVPNIMGRASSSATGVKMTPTSSAAGVGHIPEALV